MDSESDSDEGEKWSVKKYDTSPKGGSFKWSANVKVRTG